MTLHIAPNAGKIPLLHSRTVAVKIGALVKVPATQPRLPL
jgi:hypothetical protein